MVKVLSLVISLVMLTSLCYAGGPVSYKREITLPPILPPPIVQPLVPAPLPPMPPPPPRMRAFGGATIYMTDYKVSFSQPIWPRFNFGEAFGWSTKEAVSEYSVGFMIPRLVETTFSWTAPVLRAGTGVPSVPITVGGFTFGPRPADTIDLKTELSGERMIIATPILRDRILMPAVMGEWWHLNAQVIGAPNMGTTSVPPIDVKQKWNKMLFGAGFTGESCNTPLCLNYKALYVMGGASHGWLAQIGAGYKQNNMAAQIGYRYNTRNIGTVNGDFVLETNGPFVDLKVVF